MSANMKPEDLMKKISEMSGKEQIEILIEEVDKAMKEKQNQITMLQGEIRGFASVKRLMGAFVKQDVSEGVQEAVQEEMEEQKASKEPQESEIEKERKERLADGKCVFKAKKSDGGKWCRRSLKTKEEKESGYCKTHMKKLGLAE